MSWHDDARARFPHLGECTYLNTAAAGLAWTGQGAAAAAHWDLGMRDGYDAREAWRARSARAAERVAALLGVPASHVLFAGTTTDALNRIAAALPWRPGDRVVLAADEFPSVRLAWTVAERAGATVLEVPVPAESARGAALLAALEPGVRVLAVSHVHWETGTRVDLDALGAACRANGTLLVVDGIQALGAVPVDAAAADAYCAATFKWLLSGFGLAIMVVGERLQAALDPAQRGYLNPPPSRSLQASHANHPGLHVLDATLGLLERIGWDRIHAQVDALGAALHAAASQAGFEPATPSGARAGIVSLRCAEPEGALARLHELGFRLEQRGALLRASPHFYNSIDEVGSFVDALRRVARPLTGRS